MNICRSIGFKPFMAGCLVMTMMAGTSAFADSVNEDLFTSTTLQQKIIQEMRVFKPGEGDALLDVITSCRADEGDYESEVLYKIYSKNCDRAKTVWDTKFGQKALCVTPECREYKWARELEHQQFNFNDSTLWAAADQIEIEKEIVQLAKRLGDSKKQIKALNELYDTQKKVGKAVDRYNSFLRLLSELMIAARK